MFDERELTFGIANRLGEVGLRHSTDKLISANSLTAKFIGQQFQISLFSGIQFCNFDFHNFSGWRYRR